MEDEHIHIPNRLRKHRKLMGYTQTEVAKLLGVKTHERISKWEKGTQIPNVINLIKLSILYRAFPTDLYYDLMTILRTEIEERLKYHCLKDISKNTDD